MELSRREERLGSDGDDGLPCNSGKPRCFLHIGTPKTGSTSIQLAFARNRKVLRKAGILYPPQLKKQSGEFAFLFSDEPEHTRTYRKRFFGVESFRKFRDEKLAALSEVARRRRDADFVFSAEQLSNFSDSEIERMGAWLMEQFREVRIIAYLRAPHDFYISYYSTKLLNGSPRAFSFPRRVHDYTRLAEKYGRVFGAGSVCFRPFIRRELRDQDVTVDFLATIGRGDIEFGEIPRALNPAYSAEAQECVRRLNEGFRAGGGTAQQRRRLKLKGFLQKNFQGRGYYPPTTEVQKFVDCHRAIYENYSLATGGCDFTELGDAAQHGFDDSGVNEIIPKFIDHLGSVLLPDLERLYHECLVSLQGRRF